MSNFYKPLLLVILDGWGVAAPSESNAISLARKPYLDSCFASFPNTILKAAGEAVGLPHGESGNSEVGHLNLGAGRIVYQDLSRINTAIADGTFIENKAFNEAIVHVKKEGSRLHVMGLVGSGAVHSSVEHLYALLWLLKQRGLNDIYLHLFTDGRDSPPSSALQIFTELDLKLRELGIGKIATIVGRYFAMDRDQRWERTEKAYRAAVFSEGRRAKDALEAIRESYSRKTTDEFIEPTIIGGTKTNGLAIADNDAVIFFNYRPERARQLTKAFVEKNFKGFNRGSELENLFFVSMTAYERNLPAKVAFSAPVINYPLSAIISAKNITQIHIGETEKYAHVTYFFNGGSEAPFPGEERIHIPSSKVATYDLRPEMSAKEITDTIIQKLKLRSYGFYVINFANADMVAHTGSTEATIKAVEFLDLCLGRIVSEAFPFGGIVVVVGDHGNAEQMINPVTGNIDTEHSSNSVPFLVISEELKSLSNKRLQAGILADVAPTILYLLGLPAPEDMTGRNLLA